MTKRSEQSRCRRCLGINDNFDSHPNGRRIALCKSCVAARSEDERQREARRAQGRIAPLWSPADCQQCGDKFTPRSSNQRFCGAACRNLYLKEWRKNKGPSIDEPIPCDVCGSQFVRRSGNQKYCSQGCADAAKDHKQSERALRSRYMMTPIQFRDMYDRQGGACAICGYKFTSRTSIHVDHDHSCCPTGVSCGGCVRGLLCRRCNTLIGQADDDLNVLRKAIAYLS